MLAYKEFRELYRESAALVKCSGRLGNQLFELAMAHQLALAAKCPVALEFSHFDLHYGHEGFLFESLIDRLRGRAHCL